jgi:hypothetical protein
MYRHKPIMENSGLRYEKHVANANRPITACVTTKSRVRSEELKDAESRIGLRFGVELLDQVPGALHG